MKRMKRLTLWIMALTAGLVVANNYYNQPLLGDLAASFGVREQQASNIAALTQLGYALGMLFLLPLGDKVERRNLISIMLLLAAGALLAFAAAGNFPQLLLFGFLIGFCSIVPQILPTFAAKVAGPDGAGEAIGLVMGGLLLGILLSRFVGGELGHWFGWRTVYFLAAAIMLLLLATLRLTLPKVAPTFQGGYGELLASLAALFRRHTVLRVTAIGAALQFAAFSLFWTTLAFYLLSLDRGYTAATAGLFGLVGAGGALAAPVAGRLSRRLSAPGLLLIGGSLMTLSFISYAMAHGQLLALIPGVVLMDLGMQISHVISMHCNYRLDPQAVSRLNTLYMVTRFFGGALGTFAGGIVWPLAGWLGVCVLGVFFCLLALVLQQRLRRLITPNG
ncbi:MFS transporter [Martelella alba]|nr:MFS transporter [Martelella alba]